MLLNGAAARPRRGVQAAAAPAVCRRQLPDGRRPSLHHPPRLPCQIWDTAGQERFQSLGVAFYRGADCCVLVRRWDREAAAAVQGVHRGGGAIVRCREGAPGAGRPAQAWEGCARRAVEHTPGPAALGACNGHSPDPPAAHTWQVYDVNNSKTFDNLENWRDEFLIQVSTRVLRSGWARGGAPRLRASGCVACAAIQWRLETAHLEERVASGEGGRVQTDMAQQGGAVCTPPTSHVPHPPSSPPTPRPPHPTPTPSPLLRWATRWTWRAGARGRCGPKGLRMRPKAPQQPMVACSTTLQSGNWRQGVAGAPAPRLLPAQSYCVPPPHCRPSRCPTRRRGSGAPQRAASPTLTRRQRWAGGRGCMGAFSWGRATRALPSASAHLPLLPLLPLLIRSSPLTLSASFRCLCCCAQEDLNVDEAFQTIARNALKNEAEEELYIPEVSKHVTCRGQAHGSMMDVGLCKWVGT